MSPTTRQHWIKHVWSGWIRPFAFFVLLTAPLRSAVVDWNWVPSGSMKPTIVEGDLLLINKLAYDLRVPFTTSRLAHWDEPRRGDIVVCLSPEDGTRLVKRVVGLPGDVLELRNEVLFINGERQTYRVVAASPYARDVFEDPNPIVAIEQLEQAPHLVIILPGRAAVRSTSAVTVAPGHYFLMGDSRNNSNDSRMFGTVAREQILGQAHRVLVSFDPQRFLLPRLGRFGQALDDVHGP